jgi:hypothetical protein
MIWKRGKIISAISFENRCFTKKYNYPGWGKKDRMISGKF